jgi:hypothetical protein
LFSAIAIATLALGIGGITAIFSAFDAILIRPLPYADADRLTMVWDDMSKSEGDSTFFSTPLNGPSGDVSTRYSPISRAANWATPFCPVTENRKRSKRGK